MRVDKSIAIDASRDEIWELISDPCRYPEFMGHVTRLERKDDGPERGLGARFSVRMRVGSADVGGLVEIVEFEEPADLAWTSVTGIDQRLRWRLREADDGRTKVTVRLAYDAPGALGTLSEQVSRPMVARNLEETLHNLRRAIEGGSGGVSEQGMGIPGRVAYQLGSVKILVDAGVVRPMRPDRLVRVLQTLARWGRSPAAGTISLAMRYPDETVIVDELGTLTYSELHTRSNALAHALSDAGIVEGDGVAIMCRNHRGFVEATVAVSKLGADALYLNTAFAAPQLTEVVEREKPKAIVYDEEFGELLADAGKRRKRFIAWHDSDESLPDPTIGELIADGDPEDVVPPEREGRAVILTSGTTGSPKGASRGNPQSLDPVVSLLSKIPLKTRQVTHIAAPLFHSWGFAHFSLGLILGSTYVLRRKFDPEACLAEVARYRCDSLVVVPVMMQRILELPEETREKYDVSSLKAVAASGSALPGDLAINWMDAFGDTLYNLYGSTEVAWASIATPADMRAAPGTAGRPPRGTVVKLYDEKGVEVSPGQTGRIFVGNEMLFEGYTGGGSKDVIDGLMATGDVGRFDEAGRLFVEGRDDEMIVSGGENVFPKEVEDLLSRHDAVADAAAIGVEDKDFGQRLRAFVVLENGKKASEDELKGYVKQNLARYKVPREIVFLDELPRNATGKVLKRELKELEPEKAGA
jgi:acyl-CoA synthetase (AMP-forming)/AMP-acid ligase II/carbon monoxide dehydrogenase subunit G